ncbi:hypothetical protein HYZ41_01450 [archaeon]|nr:hypothetical protein [archaeon]
MKEIVKPFGDEKVGGVIGRTIASKKGVFWYHMENDYLQFIGHNSAYRAKIVKKIGGFDEKFWIAREDTDLAWSVLDLGYSILYCEKARMLHISKKVSVFHRIRNQKTFVYDALLHKKHPELYKKYFYSKGMPATLWPSVFSPFLLLIFLYSLISFRILAELMVAAYVIVVIREVIGDRVGTPWDKLMMLLFIWLLPLSRFYYCTKGYVKYIVLTIRTVGHICLVVLAY